MDDIKGLIDKVESNEIILPEFQREYVWDKKQAKSLINSLYQGFPIGSLLVWQTESPPEIKNDAVNENQRRLFKVLLDGQQRLTVLYLLTRNEIPPYYSEEEIQEDPRNLYFNLETSELHYENKIIKQNPEWVKLIDLFQEEVDAFEIATEKTETDKEAFEKSKEYSQKIDRMRDIKKKGMPTMKLPKEAEIHEAIELFHRVNSEGTDLGEPELALAHMSANWPHIRRRMKEKQKELKEKGFDFELDFYVKCTVAALTETMIYEKVYGIGGEELEETWKDLEDTLDFTVRFLKDECYIPNSNYLSTRAVLIPLVAYLNQNDNRLSREEKKSFRKWIYPALMWRRYSRATDTTLNKDLSLMNTEKGDPTSELIKQIEEDVGRIKVEASDLAKRGKRSKRFYNMLKIITRAQKPVDWNTGEPLRGNFELESHHIFPKSILYNNEYDTSEDTKIVNEVANRAFITPKTNREIFNNPPSKYLPKVKEDHPEALKKQFIPENSELWKLDNYEDFLHKRRKKIAEAINEFMEEIDHGDEKGEGEGKEIEKIIENGESYKTEFKETLLWDVHRERPNKELKEEIAKEISAFANSEGGNLIIGVDDSKRIRGLDRDFKLMKKKDNPKDSFREMLNQELNDKLGSNVASIYTTIEFKEVQGEEVCVVSVEPSPKPVYFGEEDEFYARSGSSTRPLSPREANEYIEENWS